MDTFERWLRALGGLASIGTLTLALLGILESIRRPSGRVEPGARLALRAPVLLGATILFLSVGALLWRPLPLRVPPQWGAGVPLFGALVFFPSLGLYLWGLKSLGEMFGPSSGLGVRLHAHHHLVTAGPYALVRHPMYLGVIGAGIGALFLYRTWATLAFAFTMLGLVFRARREEKVLHEEFGPEWEAYASHVPAWLPRFGARRASGA